MIITESIHVHSRIKFCLLKFMSSKPSFIQSCIAYWYLIFKISLKVWVTGLYFKVEPLDILPSSARALGISTTPFQQPSRNSLVSTDFIYGLLGSPLFMLYFRSFSKQIADKFNIKDSVLSHYGLSFIQYNYYCIPISWCKL